MDDAARGARPATKPQPDAARRTAPLLAWAPPVPGWSVALVVAIGIMLRGFDSTAGQAASCLLNALLLTAVLLRDPPGTAFWRGAAPVLGLIAAAIGWGLLVSLQDGWTVPDYTPGKVLSLVSGTVALLIGAVLGRRRGDIPALLDWLLSVGCAILIVGLVLRPYAGTGLLDGWAFDNEDRYLGSIGNANVMAAMAGVMAVLAFARFTGTGAPLVWARWTGGRIVTVPMFALAVGVVLLTGSRFTTAALLLAVVALGAERLLRRRLRLNRAALAAGLATLVALVVVAPFSGVVRDRFDLFSKGFDERVAIWSHLSAVAGRSPITGYGLGAFSTINAHFLDGPRYAQATWTINSPHNLVLQLVLQAGWPYALLLGAAALAVVRHTLAARRGDWRQDDATIVAAVGLVLTCAMVDVVLEMPCAVTLTLFLAGLLWGYRLDASKSASPRRAASQRTANAR